MTGTVPVAIGRKINLALVFTGRQLRLYAGGKLTVQKDLGDLSVEKVKWPFSLGFEFTGEVSEVRFSKVARYNKDFTPQPRFEADADTVGLYHFDEGQGEVLKDSSGNQNHGQINGATWVKADGRPLNSPAHSAPSQFALQFASKGTVRGSVQIPSLVVDFSRPCTMEGYATARGQGGYPFLCDGAAGVAAGGVWCFNFYGDDPNGKRKIVYEYGTFRMAMGKRTHLALVFTGRQFRLYVDGNLSAKKDLGDLSLEKINLPFTLGSQFTGERFEVRVSKVARYDKDFTPQPHFEPDADTLALYHFDEGQGEVLYDSSGNGHHGKIVGAKWVKLDELAAFDAWLRDVAKMQAEKQVEAVAAKLKERNPGFEGQVEHRNDKGVAILRLSGYPDPSKVGHRIDTGVVTELRFATDNVTDIAPIQALAGLQLLNCSGSTVVKGKLLDLSPFVGMKLTRLVCAHNPLTDLSPLRQVPLTSLDFSYTSVSDLAPLKDVPLTSLNCTGTKVSDLSPLRDMPLQSLVCGFNPNLKDLSPLKGMKLTDLHIGLLPITDLSPLTGMPLKSLSCDQKAASQNAEILRSIKTLQTINGKPAAEVLKEKNEK